MDQKVHALMDHLSIYISCLKLLDLYKFILSSLFSFFLCVHNLGACLENHYFLLNLDLYMQSCDWCVHVGGCAHICVHVYVCMRAYMRTTA